MFSRRLLAGGEEDGLLGVSMGRTIFWSSASGGVAPPCREGTRAGLVLLGEGGEGWNWQDCERGLLLACCWSRFSVGVTSREA